MCMYICIHLYRQMCMCIYVCIYVYVTGSEIRIWNWWDGSCIAVRDSRMGMPMDVQAGWHDSTACICKVFPHLKREVDNRDISRWYHCHCTYVKGWELYKESAHEPQGSGLGFWLQYIWLHLIRSHRPSILATSVPLRSGTITRKGSVLYSVQL